MSDNIGKPVREKGKVITSRNLHHADTGTPTVFVYDGIPGGAGLAERIRSTVARRRFPISNSQLARTSCSIGFARYPFVEDDPYLLSWEQTLNIADVALYRAKARRNTWIGWTGTRNAAGLSDLPGLIVANPMAAVNGGLIEGLNQAAAPAADPPGTPGELFVRRYDGIFDEYWKKPEATRETARGEWYSVGDVAWMDADGFVYICDRKRDMIISGGVNIYPAEIEQCLHTHAAVVDCAVFGIPDARVGEIVKAVVEVRAPVTPEELQAHCREHLATYKTPEVVEIVDDGPGIPADIRERIFDPFFSTKEVGKGVGLGLDIVRRSLERHDGEIEVESRPGRTAFRVRLPAEGMRSSGRLSRSTKRIQIAE